MVIGTSDNLDQKRKSLKNSITRLINLLNTHTAANPFTLGQVETYLATLQSYENKHEAIHNAFLEKCIDQAGLDLQEKEAEPIEVALLQMRVRLTEILKEVTPPNANPPPVPNKIVQDTIRLPTINLPIFDSNQGNWVTFRDQFIATVHNNTGLSGAIKLQYLNSVVKGEAASLINAIPIADANYRQAWDALNDRYDNDREILNSILDKLFDQPTVERESANSLRKLIDTTNECRRALRSLNRPVEHWDDIIIHLVVKRLDPETRRQWAMKLEGKIIPDYNKLQQFMDNHIRGLVASGAPAPNSSSSSKSAPSSSYPRAQQQPHKSNGGGAVKLKHYSSHHVSTANCHLCKGDHHLHQCQQYTSLDLKGKEAVVRKNSLCHNCLKPNHSSQDCYSKFTCHKCHKKHHTSLHREDSSPAVQENKSVTSGVVSHIGSEIGTQVLLSTATVHIKDGVGGKMQCRALLDNGSQVSFITENCLQRLGLKRMRSHTTINGVGDSGTGKCRGSVNLEVNSIIKPFKLHVRALVLNHITSNLPSSSVEVKSWAHLDSLKLADPKFNESGPIDLLFGADVFDLLTTVGKIERSTTLPSAQNTHLGWIISGPHLNQQHSKQPSVVAHIATIDIQDQLKKFWELEEVDNNKQFLTKEEQQCEERFRTTHCRDPTGRYIVSLPSKSDSIELGGSRSLAIKRLEQVERRLSAKPELKQKYQDFMTEYENLGHMEQVPQSEIHESKNRINYLPHHFVLKESTTTALRVVFDGSAKTTNGKSLNDCLLIGPRLQQDIFNILLRFGLYKIAFTADIGKMFRQVRISAADADLQRIVWRNSPDDVIKDYRLLTVTYGTGPGPYLSAKTLQQIAQDEGKKFPLAQPVVMEDFYVDDVMSGTQQLHTAIKLKTQLIEMLDRGGLQLRKWTSNSAELLESLPPEFRETQLPLLLDSDDAIKALGLHWHPAGDYFFFKINLPPEPKRITKRSILSEVSKLYDPLGWLSPVIIVGKILMQKLWISGVGWDEPVPDQLVNEWTEFRQQLFGLENLKINRFIGDGSASYQLHGFSDASDQAYSSAVYLRTVSNNNEIQVRLLCSKTKVAPVKYIGTPRMELCGAVLSARLIQKVKNSLNISIESIHAWTDSTIVLDWIRGQPNRWKIFVRNRVTEIQDLVAPEHWHHVISEENPADQPSRGILASEILNNQLWWQGPAWLSNEQQQWRISDPTVSSIAKLQMEKELRPVKSLVAQLAQPIQEPELLERYSNLMRFLRITALCFRFCKNARNSKACRITKSLNTTEIKSSLTNWIRITQQQHFSEIIKAINNKKPIKNKYASLAPFLDSEGILRVGGRLKNSDFAYDRKHPILLPKKSTLTTLIIDHEHRTSQHGGSQLMLALLQQKYWIVNGRNLIRQHIFKCMKCFRERAATSHQQMGHLPSSRLQPTRAFLTSGVDYAGPVLLKTVKGRGGRNYKAYIALFVCCSTKAVHLELVTDLTTEGFIAALKRFVGRRGHCTDLYSDNGTNFVGANNELRDLFEFFKDENQQKSIGNYLTGIGMNWHFIPARAPHFGGLWEAGVKSTKLHLRRVLGSTALTYEEFSTTLIQIEACLNSRPLTPMTADPNNLDVLTPGHFLIGEPLLAIPEPDLSHLSINRLSRFQMTQQLTQHFWKRWSLEYLSNLQQRNKWQAPTQNISIGNLVLIKEDNIPPQQWIMARVTSTTAGKDGLVRVATVKTASGNLTRPIVKLSLLPFNDNE